MLLRPTTMREIATRDNELGPEPFDQLIGELLRKELNDHDQYVDGPPS